MIHYLKRHQIAVNKYDNCIKYAVNSRIYAYSWYLDIVADNWDVLVLNDYEAVMPLPWKSKYFIKYVYPPAWTQQLGVFSEKEISSELILQFIKAIPKKFKKITIQFNSENDLSLFKTQKRVNYILPLNKSYNEIYKGFNKNRKRDLKKAEREGLIVEKVEINKLIEIANSEYQQLNYTKKDYKKLRLLVEFKRESFKVDILGVNSNNKNIYGGVIFLRYNKRITYLFSIMNTEAKNKKSVGYIISKVINANSNEDFILDFEGSMKDGIARFFCSFGSKEEFYYSLQYYNFL